MAAHSKIVGGSTAKRVIACPGSVALCAAMPPKPSSPYADEGTLLHNAIASILTSENAGPTNVIGMTYEGVVLTQELYDEKLLPAYQALDIVDPNGMMEFEVEAEVSFGKYLPGVFGFADVVGRISNKAIVADWKFGDGVGVSVEENEQLMFYAAAAMRTKETAWVFDGATEIELMIIQPTVGGLKRWTTTPQRIKAFEKDLKAAVKASAKPDAKLVVGEHCRWCAAKPICPKMTGAVDRALKLQIEGLDVTHINAYLKNAELLEGWISDLRAVAFQMLEKGVKLPDWKLVQKRGTRKWTDESQAKAALLALGVTESDVTKTELLSPAQAEKVLKKHKLALPEEVITSVSSGTTLAPRDDPRLEVLQLGQQLAGLSKIL